MKKWGYRKLDYDSSSNIIYRGFAKEIGTKIDEEKWYIWKYNYTDGNIVDIIGPILGRWDKRENLF